MSRSALSWPVVIVGIAHLVYGAVVITLWLVDGKTPPPAVGSFIAASIVSGLILATGRNSRAEIQALAKLYAELAERVREIEERQAAPQRPYMVPAEPQPADKMHVGMDPKAVDAIHRLQDRLRPSDAS